MAFLSVQPWPLLTEDTWQQKDSVFSHTKKLLMLEALNYGSLETPFPSIILYLWNSQGPFSEGINSRKGKHEPQTE